MSSARRKSALVLVAALAVESCAWRTVSVTVRNTSGEPLGGRPVVASSSESLILCPHSPWSDLEHGERGEGESCGRTVSGETDAQGRFKVDYRWRPRGLFACFPFGCYTKGVIETETTAPDGTSVRTAIDILND